MKTRNESSDKGVVARKSAIAPKPKKHSHLRPLPTPRPAEPVRLTRSMTLRELKQEAARLKEEIKRQEVLTQDHPTSGNHMADDASEVYEETKNLALKAHLERMLEEVESALARLECGAYGVCQRCNKPIDPERLQALPTATLCVECARVMQHSTTRTPPRAG